jgi:hypothetical protein
MLVLLPRTRATRVLHLFVAGTEGHGLAALASCGGFAQRIGEDTHFGAGKAIADVVLRPRDRLVADRR